MFLFKSILCQSRTCLVDCLFWGTVTNQLLVSTSIEVGALAVCKTEANLVEVVPNSLQDIGRASDGVKRRPVEAEGLPLLGFLGDLIL
jgi:hypothetical protein